VERLIKSPLHCIFRFLNKKHFYRSSSRTNNETILS